jgi:hypothetical protein
MEQGKKGIMGKTFLNRILSLPQHSIIPIFQHFNIPLFQHSNMPYFWLRLGRSVASVISS